MSLEDINALEEEDKNSGKAPRAQYVLAEEVTGMVHGAEGLAAAKRITQSLFSGALHDMTEADLPSWRRTACRPSNWMATPICSRRW